MLDSAGFIIVVITLAFLFTGIVGLITYSLSGKPKSFNSFSGPLTIVGGLGMALMIVINLFYFFPYDLKYQTWEPQEKMVRFTQFDMQADRGRDGNGGLKITFADGTTAFTNDFRLATTQGGERMSMLCKPEFVPGNADKIWCKAPTGG